MHSCILVTGHVYIETSQTQMATGNYIWLKNGFLAFEMT